jgi:hypothetical protein
LVKEQQMEQQMEQKEQHVEQLVMPIGSVQPQTSSSATVFAASTLMGLMLSMEGKAEGRMGKAEGRVGRVGRAEGRGGGAESGDWHSCGSTSCSGDGV